MDSVLFGALQSLGLSAPDLIIAALLAWNLQRQGKISEKINATTSRLTERVIVLETIEARKAN
ncbi:hypothetical protein ST37_01715 (plasmid) [Vibrio sp. qd031]|uniref:hypothetical protein n=1 Tax=Vibrio sp. qd031 TaxID=1603038 RepID=UPI000A108038|nr:hypothetical protein [Vibrio sp. qd031]ORT52513.1 hypothetical protein ST37_01715 [Vibrio sp. qd031]